MCSLEMTEQPGKREAIKIEGYKTSHQQIIERQTHFTNSLVRFDNVICYCNTENILAQEIESVEVIFGEDLRLSTWLK